MWRLAQQDESESFYRSGNMWRLAQQDEVNYFIDTEICEDLLNKTKWIIL